MNKIYKEFELISTDEYRVWKDGRCFFKGTLKECKGFLDENPTGHREKWSE